MIRATPLVPLASLLLVLARPAPTQVLIRIADPHRASYSELHEGLRQGTPAADSALAILRTTRPALLWRRVRAALSGSGEWNDGHLALTRLAQLRSAAYADSAKKLRGRLQSGGVKGPPGREPSDFIAPLDAVLRNAPGEPGGMPPSLPTCSLWCLPGTTAWARPGYSGGWPAPPIRSRPDWSTPRMPSSRFDT